MSRRRRLFFAAIASIAAIAVIASIVHAAPRAQAAPPESNRTTSRVPSKDGTAIAVECAGAGPTLLLVHGGIGDRTRWTPMFPLLESRFTACAMDRRGHGESGDGADYDLGKEAEDVAAVVDSLPGPVFLLGHSYGGVAALEAAFLSGNVAELVLYEPPVVDPSDPAMIEKIERLIAAGQREEAALTFWREVVKYSEAELDAMRARPSWPGLVADFDSHPRQMRALAAYRFDEERMRSLATPTLLLLGGETKSPALKRAIERLDASLPHSTVVVLEGQEHNAMDRDREQLARVLTTHLLAP